MKSPKLDPAPNSTRLKTCLTGQKTGDVNNQNFSLLFTSLKYFLPACVMLTCIPIKHWAILVPTCMLKMTERFVKVLQNTANHLGFSLAEPFIIQIESDEINNINKELKTLLGKEKPQIVFCMLTSNREDRYRAVKKMCTVEYGGNNLTN